MMTHQPPTQDHFTPAPWQQQSQPTLPPATGWRKWFGRGPSPAEIELAQWIATIKSQARLHRITTSQAKGGVGKTTTAVGIGTVLAKYRADNTIVIDANPDVGTLAQRAGRKHDRTIRDLITEQARIQTVNDVRHFTHQADSRLEVLAADLDPGKRRSFSPEDYELVQRILATFWQVIISDTGTDQTHPVMPLVTDYTDTLVVPCSTALDSAQLGWQTLNAWRQRGERGALLADRAVIAVVDQTSAEAQAGSRSPGQKPDQQMRLDRLVDYFSQDSNRTVVVIPWDRHLVQGGVFQWESLAKPTQRAYIELAAAVAYDFQNTL